MNLKKSMTNKDSTLLLQMMENMHQSIMVMSSSLSDIKVTQGQNSIKIENIEAQTMRTNGRVTKLEDLTAELSKANIMLANTVSKQNGLYEQNIHRLESELGSKLPLNKLDTEIEVVKVENKGKITLAIVGGVVSIASLLITTYFALN